MWCLSDVFADTHSDTWETGRRKISLSASISTSSAKLLLLCSGGCDCTSKNSELCFTINAHTFTLTHWETGVLMEISWSDIQWCKGTRKHCVEDINPIFLIRTMFFGRKKNARLQRAVGKMQVNCYKIPFLFIKNTKRPNITKVHTFQSKTIAHKRRKVS